MNPENSLAERFDANRAHLHAVAYRMLGSAAEADDAVQEAWLRLSRSDADDIGNLGGWLTTVVSRVCLDMLRARKTRGEESIDEQASESHAAPARSVEPEHEALLADSVGLALLVVLRALAPAERVAFVLHDLFDLSFDEIAPIVERTPTAARQLASRARRRVRGLPDAVSPSDVERQRAVVDAFLAASRGGNLDALLAALDPDVTFRGDAASVRLGGPAQIRGADAVAKLFVGRATLGRPAVVGDAVGAVVAPLGKLLLALRFTLKDGRIAAIEAIAEPDSLASLNFAVIGDG